MKFSTWLLINTVALVLPPIWTFQVLDRELTQAHLANPNLSGDGDSLGIPVFGVAIFTLLILCGINVIGGLIGWFIQERRRKLDAARRAAA